MQSISTSKLLLEAKNLSMDYPMNYYQHGGLRDTFVQMVQNPFNYFTRGQDILPVIRDLSLKIHEGDRLGILGVNGAGKTTLCRILCGMIKATIGSIETYGNVEAVFDTVSGIMPELTGRENAYLIMELFHNYPIDKKTIEEALVFSELDIFLDAPFKTYSKGMQTRLMLSLISTTSSDVLILDEVFDGADIFFKGKISTRMRDKIDRSGAVVFVSHGPDQVKELCNRVIVMDKGTIVYDGNTNDGLDHYLKLGERLSNTTMLDQC